MTLTAIMTIACLVIGCEHNSTPAARDLPRPSVPDVADSIVAFLGADTVRLVTDEMGNHLEWRTRESTIRWTSRSLFDGKPEVLLSYINTDSTPDLFWTIRFEEIIGGMAILGVDDGARETFTTNAMVCDVPELLDVDGDGLKDVIDYQPGALTTEQCQGDAPSLLCQAKYPTEWVVTWLQRNDAFVLDTLGAGAFYQRLEIQYTDAATRLRRMIAQDSVPEAMLLRCDQETARALEALAARAGRIARFHPLYR